MTRGAGRRDEKDHAPCSSCQPGGLDAHVDEGDKRYIRRPRSLSARASELAGPETAARELSRVREAAEPVSFLPLELNPAQPIPQGREAPPTSLSLRREPRESVHRRQLYPSSTQTKLLLETEFECMRLNEWSEPKPPSTRVAAIELTSS